MGGGLMQLVAYGAQDIYLTGNPQITFFKVVYRRHTNFSCESIKQTFNGTNSFGSTVTATISRNGDLVTNMYLQFQLPVLANQEVNNGGADALAYTNEVANALVKEVELEIGGQRIDKHYSEWLSIWSELNLTQSQKGTNILEGYNAMVGRNPTLEGGEAPTSITALETKAAGVTGGADNTYYTPLRFWFNRNPGLALPLIALQYHEVKVRMTFRAKNDLIRHQVTATSAVDTSAITLKNAALWVDYVYLDTDERRRFAQVSHEYLIEQLQEHRTTINATTANVSLNFNHPVKELVWVFVLSDREKGGVAIDNPRTGNQWLNFESISNTADVTKPQAAHFGTATLKLNGHERFEPREAPYFNLVQPLQHHTCAPQRQVYVYSFALKPEEHQPSGTCNFSRIDNAQLELKDVLGGARTLRVYAVNYNVLRIMSGMGGLAYSN
jgi:hypothetical protein